MSGKGSRYLIIFLMLLLISVSSLAVIKKSTQPIFAVTDGGTGLKADLILEIQPGNGKIWSRVSSLVGTSTQSTEKISLEVARSYSDKVNDYDYFFDINSNASVVDGPSAGAAMALGLISALQNKEIFPNVSITGTINPDGSIGQVGGVFEKAEVASEYGVKLLMIPKGEAIQTRKFGSEIKSINLIDYALSTWNVKLVEVETIDDALSYSFINPDLIDVNSSSQELPEFIPAKLNLPDELNEMKTLNENYLSETKKAIEDAKTVLSSSEIKDLALISELFSLINTSELNLTKAELLFEQNYFYSSANLSFLALAYSYLVQDIGENPSLQELGSVDFQEMVLSLEGQITSTEALLDKAVFVEKIEWLISARERLSWSKNAVKKLKAEINRSFESPEAGNNLNNLLNYEFARAWADASVSFYEIARTSDNILVKKRILEKEASDAIAGAKEVVDSADSTVFSDEIRRYDSALIEYELGWYESAMVDALSAKALIETGRDSDSETDLNVLLSRLRHEVVIVESMINESEVSFIWPRLYFDHAKFFLQSSEYYAENNSTVQALKEARGGLRLTALSKAVLQGVNAAVNEIKASPVTVNPVKDIPLSSDPKSTAQGNTTWNVSDQDASMGLLNIFILGLMFLFAIIMLLVILLFLKREKSFTFGKYKVGRVSDVEKIHTMMDEVNSAYAKGLIGKESHDKIFNEYLNRLNETKNHYLYDQKFDRDISTLRKELTQFNANTRDIERRFQKHGDSKVYLSEIKTHFDKLHRIHNSFFPKSFDSETLANLVRTKKPADAVKTFKKPRVDRKRSAKKPVKSPLNPE